MKKKSHYTNIFSKEQAVLIGSFLIVVVVLSLAIFNFMMFAGLKHGQATLILAFENNGQGRIFMGEVVPRMTVLDALITSSRAGRIEFKYVINPNNQTKIVGLNSYTDTLAKKHLTFYVNKDRVDESSINKVEIKPGDTIEVNLE